MNIVMMICDIKSRNLNLYKYIIIIIIHLIIK